MMNNEDREEDRVEINESKAGGDDTMMNNQDGNNKSKDQSEVINIVSPGDSEIAKK